MGWYEIDVSGGNLEIKGLPNGSKVVHYSSKLTRRLERLGLAAMILEQAKATLEVGRKFQTNLILCEAAAVTVASLYFSCFQSGDLGAKLNAKVVFRENPDALARHNDWLRIRDTKFNHPGETGRSNAGALILTGDYKYLDYIVIGMDVPIGNLKDWMQLLYQLVEETKKYVEQAAIDARLRTHSQ